eukprot:CAMPEP_0206445492 /NCGR_PEP_ID=MMETSP0324_2-20121206/15549_1 /ASSEMBLY_ACC=CAM_ASM_000836 /TAXON_ID=2866 /ORGANISM="Crypthecodinium cohnii, Strain Seligo" /LENGTH=358 /DNA_ID=CAMNT_0053913735 /DNA_START=176 /DNA_END=1252 /DNA_ORIENTATION=+
MFKKRERPQASRTRDTDGDGEGGSIPKAAKTARMGNVSLPSNSGSESGIIAASTKRGDSDAATKHADRYGDVGLTGFKADDSTSVKPSSDAVRRLEVDADTSHDTRAVLERNQQIHKGLKDGSLEAGVYRGIGAYKQYAERSEGAISASKYSGQLGPTRGITNVRSTLAIEYLGTTGKGGICKDYKERGYCGFGDTCIFLHDRSDYKPSYQLEKEWEEKQKAIQDKKRMKWERRQQRKAARGPDAPDSDEESSDDSDSDAGNDSDDDLPLCCMECKNRWEECKSIPVVTVCNHYFCEDCAFGSFAKSPKCLACDQPTNGIFNSVDSLEDKIKAKKAKAAEKKKEKARQKGVYGVGIEE